MSYTYQTCRCGSTKIEHKENGTCATCSRADRKAANAPPPKKRKPLKGISARMGARIVAKMAAYAIIDNSDGGKHCAACGTSRNLTHSHALSTRQYPQHEANAANLVILCLEDHEVFEHNKSAFKHLFPETWAVKMAIMEALEPAHLAKMRSKHPDLYA